MKKLALTLTLFATLLHTAPASAPAGLNPKAALSKLVTGNARYARNESIHPSQTATQRTRVAKEQHPFAVIVACSDSRVAPELIFDQGLGDLFVVRVAGNVIDDHALGSIEYAVAHLGASLIVVVGHERCGAVSATLKGGAVQGHIASLVKAIQPAVKKVKGLAGDPLENAVKANAREVAMKLRQSKPVLAEMIKTGKVQIDAGYYDLDSGRVKFLE